MKQKQQSPERKIMNWKKEKVRPKDLNATIEKPASSWQRNDGFFSSWVKQYAFEKIPKPIDGDVTADKIHTGSSTPDGAAATAASGPGDDDSWKEKAADHYPESKGSVTDWRWRYLE